MGLHISAEEGAIIMIADQPQITGRLSRHHGCTSCSRASVGTKHGTECSSVVSTKSVIELHHWENIIILQDHLVLYTTKLRDHDKVREQIQCHWKNRQNSEPVAKDVDAFVKGKHSRGSGSKFADLCKNCCNKGHWARDCRGQGGGAKEGTKGDDGERTSEGKGAVYKCDGKKRKLWNARPQG